MSEIWGVAGLAITESGSILIFPENPENGGKMEKVLGVGGMMEDIGNMREGFGGAVEEGDWVGLESVLQYALMREVHEERWVDLSVDQLQLLPEGMEVIQDRGKGAINFLVACFIVRLSSEQELFLRWNGAQDFENTENTNDLRPRDREIINIYQRTVGIPVNMEVEEFV